jgi:hypothetical protein
MNKTRGQKSRATVPLSDPYSMLTDPLILWKTAGVETSGLLIYAC